MDRIQVKSTLLNEFISEWSDRTPYALDNMRFNPPDNSEWVRIRVLNNDSEQATLGEKNNRRFTRYGRVAYQVFIPLLGGTYDGDVLCEAINNIFEGERFTDIVFYEGTWRQSEVENKDYYQFNGSIPFEFDQKK